MPTPSKSEVRNDVVTILTVFTGKTQARLGAKALDVQWLFLRRGAALVAIGLAIGAPLAVATALRYE